MLSVAAVLLAVASCRSAFAASAALGAFNVLSVNVAGLLTILNSNGEDGDKTTNTMIIGQDVSKYDYYHATLQYKYDTHPYRTATSGGVPFGSGLNTLSDFDWVDFFHTKWATCSDASKADCLTPKGFTFMLFRIDEGVYVDTVNLHIDTSTEGTDNVAHSANIQQVNDFLSANSAGNAVLVFGDTNSRYTRAVDTGIRNLVSQQGLTDAWVKHTRNGSPRWPGLMPSSVPPTLCRPTSHARLSTTSCGGFCGSQLINLSSTGFFYDTARFLSSNQTVLTDHNPALS
ncbi:Endonuclease/exonuclease/phosphatase [Trametes meyenii]|nr:Endonuclease/exonuclease/phosphatase [Trametes meyenii]